VLSGRSELFMLHRAAHRDALTSPVEGDSLEAREEHGGAIIAVRRIETSMSRAAYEIRAVGQVPSRLLEDFEGVSVAPDVAGSIIRADLADESELHGVLDALRREGFVLVDVRRETDWDQELP
jgi:hypothetical protein